MSTSPLSEVRETYQPRTGGGFGLEWLFDPVTVEAFDKDWRDAKMLHVARKQPDYFNAFFSFADLDEILSRPFVPVENAFAISTKTKLTRSDYSLPNGGANVHTLLDLYSEGATLVIREADRLHKGLWRLCRTMERRFLGLCFANVYYAPPGGQAFDVHYDALDVYVLQLAGAKSWKIYDRVGPKPLAGEHCYDDISHATQVDHLNLTAGDTFYIPRGVPHLVNAVDDFSLHISISLTPFTAMDACRLMMDGVKGSDKLRELPDHVGDLAGESLAALQSVEIAKAFRQWTRATLLTKTPVAVENPILRRMRASAISPNSRMAADPALVFLLKAAGDKIEALGPGRTLEFPRGHEKALRQALSRELFAVSALEGLESDADRVEMAAKLFKSGFVNWIDG